mmetsp:Transcript_5262/g.13419  ORF Transcript_5262/g.13419 Transcript_5262/m.13419 type:complete len:336 (-) Transcript_5262:196-1203(-)
MLAALMMIPALCLAWGKTPPPPPEPPLWQKALDWMVEVLRVAEDFSWPSLPIEISVLDTVLSIETCAGYRAAMGKDKHPWLQVFVSCCICCFGGTTLTAILLGQPPGWLGSTSSPIAFATGFWLIFLCPGDVPYKAVTRFFPLAYALNVINCMSGAHGVTSWGSEKALHAFHFGSVTAADAAAHHRSGFAGSGPFALLCGTLSGCGGGILGAFLGCNGTAPNWSFSTPPTLRKPSVYVKLAAVSSITYYCLRNPHSFLPWGQDVVDVGVSKVIVFFMWVAVMTAQDVFGIADPLGWIFPLFSPFVNLTGDVGGSAEPGIYEALFEGKKEEAKKAR